MLKPVVRKIYLSFYGFGFFVVLGIIIFVLFSYSKTVNQSYQQASPTTQPRWYLYQNERMGFSIQYPTDWSVREIAYRSDDLDTVIFQSPDFRYEDDDDKITQGMRITIDARSRSEYPSDLAQLYQEPEVTVQTEIAVVGGEESYKYVLSGVIGTEPGSDHMVVAIPHGNYVYNFACDYAMARRSDALDLCETILQTWQFTISR